MRRRQITSAYRCSVASRVLAASLGGYILISLLAALLAMILPMPRYEAVITACMVAFLAHAAIIMAVFHARSATRVWAWLIGAAVPLAIVTLSLLPEARA